MPSSSIHWIKHGKPWKSSVFDNKENKLALCAMHHDSKAQGDVRSWGHKGIASTYTWFSPSAVQMGPALCFRPVLASFISLLPSKNLDCAPTTFFPSQLFPVTARPETWRGCLLLQSPSITTNTLSYLCLSTVSHLLKDLDSEFKRSQKSGSTF